MAGDTNGCVSSCSYLGRVLCGDVRFPRELGDHRGGGWHDLSVSRQRFVEVTNLGPSSVNLDEFSINVFYNGATTAATIVPLSGALTSGDSYVVSFEGSG